MATCSSCGAEILWVKTAAGKSMPLSVASRQKRYDLIAYDPDEGAKQSETYLSHFADCPDAAKHRKPTKISCPSHPDRELGHQL